MAALTSTTNWRIAGGAAFASTILRAVARVAAASVVVITTLLAPSSARSEPFRVRPVVIAGQPAPGGGTFEHFSVETLPVVAGVNGKGLVAFFATLLRAKASEGFFLASGSASGARITKIALEGDPAPGGGTLSGFGKHPIPALNARGSVAFAAALTGARSVEGIFLSSGGRLSTVAVTGSPAPGIASGTLAALDAPALNDHGDVAFLATIRRGRETVDAIYVRAGGKLTKVVAQGDPAPAGGAFAGFGVPALNNRGAIAFAAVVEGRAVPGGVFVAEGDRIRMLAGAGDDTPIGGIFAKFSERIALDATGTVAFNAVLKNAVSAAAVFVLESGRARKVAALGDEAPGGGTFSHFGLAPALADAGAVAFTASIDRGPSGVGVFLARGTETVKIASVGDALPGGGTIASLGLYPTVSASDASPLVFAIAPSGSGEGLEAILIAAPSP